MPAYGLQQFCVAIPWTVHVAHDGHCSGCPGQYDGATVHSHTSYTTSGFPSTGCISWESVGGCAAPSEDQDICYYTQCTNASIDMSSALQALRNYIQATLGENPDDYELHSIDFGENTKEMYESFDKLRVGGLEDVDLMDGYFRDTYGSPVDRNLDLDLFSIRVWEGKKTGGDPVEDSYFSFLTGKGTPITEYGGKLDDNNWQQTYDGPSVTQICFTFYYPVNGGGYTFGKENEDSEGIDHDSDGPSGDPSTGDVVFDEDSADGRTTERISGYSPDTEWTEVQDFDNLYLPADVPIATIPGMVIGEGTYYYDLTGVYVEEIKNSLVESDMMIFVEPVKYDETGKFRVGERVFGIIYGQTKFLGYIQSKERILRDSEQYIRYTAVGSRSRLYDLGFAFEFRFTDITIKAAFEFVCSKIPSVIVNSYDTSALPVTVIPELDLGTCTYGKALDSLLDAAGHYGFYIDHTKKLTVYNLESLTQNNIRIPSEGEAIGTHKVISKDISMDISQCKTRCIIQGDYPIVEVEENIGYTIDSEGFYWLQLRPNIVKYLLSDSSKDLIIKSHVGHDLGLAPIHIDCVSGKVKCIEKLGYSLDIPQVSSSVYVRYCYKRLSPLKVDTGWVGTAYTQYQVQNTMVKHETRFRKESGAGVTPRDDTEKMKTYAEQIVTPLKDAKYGGSVSMDTLLTDYSIGQCVNFTNTSEDWSGIKLVIYSITYRISDLATQLELSNVYYLGSGIIDPRLEEKKSDRADITDLEQLKRIILDLEKRV